MPVVSGDAALNAITGWFGWRRSKDDQLRQLALPYLTLTGSAFRKLRALCDPNGVIFTAEGGVDRTRTDLGEQIGRCADAFGVLLIDHAAAADVRAVRAELAKVDDWFDVSVAFIHPELLALARAALLAAYSAATGLESAWTVPRRERRTKFVGAAARLAAAGEIRILFAEALRGGPYLDTWNYPKRLWRRRRVRAYQREVKDQVRKQNEVLLQLSREMDELRRDMEASAAVLNRRVLETDAYVRELDARHAIETDEA